MTSPDPNQPVADAVQMVPHVGSGFVRKIEVAMERFQVAILFLVLLLTAIPFIFVINAPIHGDVQLYFGVGESLSQHVMPYRDRELEYPPYAIPVFLLPRLASHNASEYQIAFAILVALTDSLLKSLLLLEGFRRNKGVSCFLPLVLYCVTVPFIRYFYLQRFDIFPAVLTVAALACFARGWFGWAGAILTVAGGVKLYPALLGPVLWVLAIRQHGGREFAAGAAVALIPLAALSFFLPWWRFLAFHGERGLQVESLYASVVWLAHLAGFTDARWVFIKAWTEVKGPLADALVPWAKLLMLCASLGSVSFATWIAGKLTIKNLFQLARLALIPLLAFVAFNIVLSPQFMVWLLPLAALGLLGGTKWPMVLIAAGTAVVPIIYPSPQYGSGIDFWQTVILIARNTALIVVWLALISEFWEAAKNRQRLGSPEVLSTPSR